MKQTIKTAVWPQDENNYIPVALRLPSIIVFFFVIFLMLVVSYIQTFQPGVLGENTTLNQTNIIEELNVERQKTGIVQLRPNEQLNTAAAAKASDMAEKGYWSHFGPDGKTPWQWIEETDYNYNVAGENLARGFSTPSGVIKAWHDSPTHRENMLDNRYRDVGVAIMPTKVYGHESSVVVLMLAKPTTAVSVSKQNDTVQDVLAGRTQTPETNTGSIFGQFAAVSMQFMQPLALVSIGMLVMLTILGFLAYIRFIAVPRELRESWHKHHGIYTAAISCLAIFATIVMFGGARI